MEPEMKIKDLLSKEKRWCKGTWFRNEFGDECKMDQAHSFCLIGAARKAYGPNYFSFSEDILTKLSTAAIELYGPERGVREFLGAPSAFAISRFNDHKDTTFEEIRQIVERADV